MNKQKSEKISEFLVNYLTYLEHDGGTGANYDMPKFELFARDYMEFAEIELNKNTDCSLINCISHLKRAIDCQLDTFLHAYHLENLFKNRNLKFETKLDFLKVSGVFSPRSLTRLNSIRNKMEHEYQIPKVKDIELFYDLVEAFVSVLERTIATLYIDSEMCFCFSEECGKEGSFSIEYDVEKPVINISYRINDERGEFVSEPNNYEEFAFFFKIYMLLFVRRGMASDKYIIKQIQEAGMSRDK